MKLDATVKTVVLLQIKNGQLTYRMPFASSYTGLETKEKLSSFIPPYTLCHWKNKTNDKHGETWTNLIPAMAQWWELNMDLEHHVQGPELSAKVAETAEARHKILFYENVISEWHLFCIDDICLYSIYSYTFNIVGRFPVIIFLHGNYCGCKVTKHITACYADNHAFWHIKHCRHYH